MRRKDHRDDRVPDQDVKAALHCLALEETEENVAQMRIMVGAMRIYQERGKSRGDLWKEAGYPDSAHHLRSKALRVSNSVKLGTEHMEGLDSALDAINYAAFFARNLTAGRKGE